MFPFTLPNPLQRQCYVQRRVSWPDSLHHLWQTLPSPPSEWSVCKYCDVWCSSEAHRLTGCEDISCRMNLPYRGGRHVSSLMHKPYEATLQQPHVKNLLIMPTSGVTDMSHCWGAWRRAVITSSTSAFCSVITKTELPFWSSDKLKAGNVSMTGSCYEDVQWAQDKHCCLQKNNRESLVYEWSLWKLSAARLQLSLVCTEVIKISFAATCITCYKAAFQICEEIKTLNNKTGRCFFLPVCI